MIYMNLLFEKLDRRHNGYDRFSHRVEVRNLINRFERDSEFVKVREWCWDNYGPSCERDFRMYKPDTKWSWHVSQTHGTCYIYLSGDTELTHFTLKWT